jgi:hypothetical protein
MITNVLATDLSFLRSGEPVTVVYYVDGNPRQVSTRLSTESPFTVQSQDEGMTDLSASQKVILLAQSNGQCFTTEATLEQLSSDSGEWSAQFQCGYWEEINRREFPRYTVILPLQVRALGESDGTLSFWVSNGQTLDASLGGVQAFIDQVPSAGSLVDVRLTLESENIVRVLGVVVRSNINRKVVGIQFLDYIGGARYQLHDYLSQHA